MDAVPAASASARADSARLFAPAAATLRRHLQLDRARRHDLRALPQRHRRRSRRPRARPRAPPTTAAPRRDVKINEVESSDAPAATGSSSSTPARAADIAGYVIKDNDDTHTITIPAGTTIAAGGYYVADIDVAGGFGLGAADWARLFAPDATVLVDSYTWTAHATTTYGRCPDGTGAFTTTTAPTQRRRERLPRRRRRPRLGRAALPSPPPTASTSFGRNMSGLAYEASGRRRPACSGPCATARARSTASSATARTGRRTRPTAGAPASAALPRRHRRSGRRGRDARRQRPGQRRSTSPPSATTAPTASAGRPCCASTRRRRRPPSTRRRTGT